MCLFLPLSQFPLCEPISFVGWTGVLARPNWVSRWHNAPWVHLLPKAGEEGHFLPDPQPCALGRASGWLHAWCCTCLTCISTCGRSCLASRDPYCVWLRTGACVAFGNDIR